MEGKTRTAVRGTPDGGGKHVQRRAPDDSIIPRCKDGDKFNTLCAAVRYGRAGLAVFPLAAGSKEPIDGSQGLLDATTDAKVLADMWPAPDCNIGLATGPVSGVWVLDVDRRHGGDTALRALVKRHGPLPDMLKTQTPGGEHWWFRWPSGIKLRNSAGRIGPGLDVRGEGGYVCVPPSRRPEGEYKWLTKGKPKGRAGIKVAPEWLITLAQTPERKYASPVPGIVDEGTRNVALTSLAGTMRDRGCEEEEIYALLAAANRHRCHPPLSDHEVRKIARSIMRYEIGKAWWAAGDAEDAQNDAWAESQAEAFERWVGNR